MENTMFPCVNCYNSIRESAGMAYDFRITSVGHEKEKIFLCRKSNINILIN